jgi:hypothetical protein
MALKPNLNTVRNKIFTASSYESLLSGSSNTYLGIAKPLGWTGGNPPVPVETTSNINDVFRNLVAIKKITSSDINLVTPRRDWVSGTTYSEYTENLDLYTYDSLTAIQGLAVAQDLQQILLQEIQSFYLEMGVKHILKLLRK